MDSNLAAAGPDGGPDSPDQTVPTLNAIKKQLGVPFVNLIFHRLAAWPSYLSRVWQRSAHLVSTREFMVATEELRRLAQPGHAVQPIRISPTFASSADAYRIKRLTDAYVHVQPKLLLLTAGWAAGLAAEPRPQRGRQVEVIQEWSAFYPEIDIPMINIPPDDGTVAKVFERMVEARAHPGVASYYRSLANWPTLVSVCWDALEPVTKSNNYLRQAAELSRTAGELASSLGLRDAGAFSTASNAEIHKLLSQWKDIQVPQLMLDTRYLQAAFEA